MNRVLTLGRLAMRAYKNPCNGSMVKVFGVGHPYCYYMQFLNLFNRDINRSYCQCKFNETCKSSLGMCKTFPPHRHNIQCNRPLCTVCKLFREYYFLCFQLLFEDKPMRFENTLKKITELFNKFGFKIYLKNVAKYNYCNYSKEFQKHEQGVVFPQFYLMFYKSNVNISTNVRRALYEIAKKEISQENPEREKLIRNIFENLKALYEIK